MTTTGGPVTAPPGGAAEQVLDLEGGTPCERRVPTGYSVVYDNLSAPSTVSGSNLQVAAGIGGGVFIVTGNSTVGAVGGANTPISATGNFVVGTGDGNNVVYATGSGQVQKVVRATISSWPLGLTSSTRPGTDLIVANGGPASINSYGNHSGILGGFASGSITTNIIGSYATVSAGATNLAATVYGSDAVIFGGTGTTQIDMGAGSVGAGATIAGGAGAETVDARAGALATSPCCSIPPVP